MRGLSLLGHTNKCVNRKVLSHNPLYYSDAVGGCDETDNDLLMAQMLQLEYDKEADQLLKREQDHYNQNSKVRVIYPAAVTWVVGRLTAE